MRVASLVLPLFEFYDFFTFCLSWCGHLGCDGNSVFVRLGALKNLVFDFPGSRAHTMLWGLILLFPSGFLRKFKIRGFGVFRPPVPNGQTMFWGLILQFSIGLPENFSFRHFGFWVFWGSAVAPCSGALDSNFPSVSQKFSVFNILGFLVFGFSGRWALGFWVPFVSWEISRFAVFGFLAGQKLPKKIFSKNAPRIVRLILGKIFFI